MHKLIDYICDELEQLERKAEKDGKLTASEIQYGDTLAHFKKNLLKAEEMTGGDYSNASYARNRDSMGRYSRDNMSYRYMPHSYNDGYSRADDFRTELQELMRMAPNDHIKQKMQNLMSEM